MVFKNTINKLQENKCYCLKRDTDIVLSECELGECHRFKACMKKANNEFDKQMGGKDGEKI